MERDNSKTTYREFRYCQMPRKGKNHMVAKNWKTHRRRGTDLEMSLCEVSSVTECRTINPD